MKGTIGVAAASNTQLNQASGQGQRRRPEVGANAVQRGLDAGVDVVRVQVVQHQEAADDLVVGEGPNQGRVALLRDLDDPGEARRIQAHDGAHQPFGALQGHLVAGLGELVEDLLDLLRLVLRALVGS